MISFKLISILNLFLIIQLSDASPIKFDELSATDLRGNHVSFSKYSGRLVLFYQMHPFLHKPKQQVEYLNALYDEYHDKGVDIIVFSSKHNFGRIFNRLFFKYHPKFDMYEHKYAFKINEFLSVQPLTYMTSRHLFFVLQDGRTFLSSKFHHPLGDPKEMYMLKGIKFDIEFYLTHSIRNPKN